MADFRTEHDWLGECALPHAAYYDMHTLRAIANFPISGRPISSWPDLIVALAMVKQAAAAANCELGLLERERAQAICAACEQVRAAPAPRST